jgi:hypothetical protein
MSPVLLPANREVKLGGNGVGSSAQLRAARALLRWSALDLAKASKVGVATIRRVEVMEGEIPVTSANQAALRTALEAAGIEFIARTVADQACAYESQKKIRK